MNVYPPGPVEGPILSESAWTGRLPPPRPHVAVVIVYRRGDHEVMWPHARGRVTLSRRPTTLYEVDLSLHQTDFEAEVPSHAEGCPFRASITIQWRVIDPSAVIRHRVADPTEALAPHVLQRIRGITRSYDITETHVAEDTINEQLGGAVSEVAGHGSAPAALAGPGAEYGLWSRIIAHLSMDEAATEHRAKMAKLTWAIEEEKAAQALRLLQEQHQQQITADRLDTYRQIIAAGGTERFALQLAENPGDIAAIEKIIRDEQRLSRRDTIDFVSHMVDSGVIERWQVNDEVKAALAWLREATARVIPERQDGTGAGPRESRRGRIIIMPGESEPQLQQPTTNGHAPGPDEEDGPPSP
jgi:hypothetical protein